MIYWPHLSLWVMCIILRRCSLCSEEAEHIEASHPLAGGKGRVRGCVEQGSLLSSAAGTLTPQKFAEEAGRTGCRKGGEVRETDEERGEGENGTKRTF